MAPQAGEVTHPDRAGLPVMPELLFALVTAWFVALIVLWRDDD